MAICKKGPQDSVGAYKGVLFPGLLRSDIHCWAAKGAAQSLFNDSLKLEIIQFLHQNSGKIHESTSFLSLTLFMVGKKAERAKPVVMFICDDKDARKEAFDMVKESDLLGSYPDFELDHTNLGKVMALSGDLESRDEFAQITSGSSIESIRIFAEPHSSDRSRTLATGGGLVIHQGKYMLLTVNHFLETDFLQREDRSPDCEMTGFAESEDDSDVETDSARKSPPEETPPLKEAGKLDCELTGHAWFGDDDDEDDIDINHGTSQGSVSGVSDRDSTDEMSSSGTASEGAPKYSSHDGSDLRSYEVGVEPQMAALWEMSGTKEGFYKDGSDDLFGYEAATALPQNEAPLKADTTFIRSRNLDYVLIELDDWNRFVSHLIFDRALNIEDFSCIGTAPTVGPVQTVTPSGGTIRGVMTGELHHIRPPRSRQFVEVFMAKFNWPLSHGDCGSWVTDVRTGQLLGHIVAAIPTDGQVVIMPAYAVFRDALASTEKAIELWADDLTMRNCLTSDDSFLWSLDSLPELSDNNSSTASCSGSVCDFGEVSALRNDFDITEEEEDGWEENMDIEAPIKGMPYVHELPSPILAVPNINHKQNPAQKSRSDTIGGVKIEEEANFWEESTDIEDSSNNPRRQYRAQTPRRASRRLTTKEEASFVCEVEGCFKMFSRSHHFEAHMKTHDEKRDYPFPCTIADCNKKFVCRTDLQRHHQAAHMKERLHRCDYCARLFARKDTLRRHVEDGCSKRFDLGELNLKQDSLPEPSMGTSNSCSTEVDHVGGMQDTQLYRDHVNTPGGLFFDGGT